MSEVKSSDLLVIPDRPQISVSVDSHGDVTIRVSGIASHFESVEFQEVTIPAECVEDVAKAIAKAII